MFRLIAESSRKRIELLDNDLRDQAAKYLADMAAEAVRGDNDELPQAKRRGRPPANKDSGPSSSIQLDQADDIPE